jgi:hypothetical protein
MMARTQPTCCTYDGPPRWWLEVEARATSSSTRPGEAAAYVDEHGPYEHGLPRDHGLRKPIIARSLGYDGELSAHPLG